MSNLAETSGTASGSRGQAKKRQKSAGPLLPGKEGITKNIQWRPQRSSGAPDKRGEGAVYRRRSSEMGSSMARSWIL